MKILAVETATSHQSVAIVDDARVLACVEREAEGSHAKSLILSIDAALDAAKCRLPDIAACAVSIGPGSFTGLRVGLATLLGFRTVLGVPLLTVPTLEAMAWNLRTQAGPLCPVLKSRKNELYWGQYEWLPDHILRCLIPARAGSPEDLAQSICTPVTCFGEGWDMYQPLICEALGSRRSLISQGPRTASRPSAITVAMAAHRRLLAGEIAGLGIAPLYVQRAEAEIKYDESGGIPAIERLKHRASKRLHRKPRRTSSGRTSRGAA